MKEKRQRSRRRLFGGAMARSEELKRQRRHLGGLKAGRNTMALARGGSIKAIKYPRGAASENDMRKA